MSPSLPHSTTRAITLTPRPVNLLSLSIVTTEASRKVIFSHFPNGSYPDPVLQSDPFVGPKCTNFKELSYNTDVVTNAHATNTHLTSQRSKPPLITHKKCHQFVTLITETDDSNARKFQTETSPRKIFDNNKRFNLVSSLSDILGRQICSHFPRWHSLSGKPSALAAHT